MSGSRFVFHDVDRNRWDDLVLLFDGRGGPKYCWCMAWRQKPAKTKYSDSKERNAALKAALHERTTRDIPIGIIGYDGDAPVAWCSIAPRPTYRRLGGPDDCADDPNSVWSLACFFVKRDFRGQGMTGQLLQAAIARAARRRNDRRSLSGRPDIAELPVHGICQRV